VTPRQKQLAIHAIQQQIEMKKARMDQILIREQYQRDTQCREQYTITKETNAKTYKKLQGQISELRRTQDAIHILEETEA
jgi:predicted Holliday junction resolvase-like endonuclease